MYNKYPTRNSGRYNTPGRFVPAGEYQPSPQNSYQQQPQQQQHIEQQLTQQIQQNLHEIPLKDDVEMKCEDESMTSEERPAWMKSKLPGVKKISNKERRRRQNKTLRRLLTPKNALMVLNEMKPNEQITNQFKVEQAQTNQTFFNKNVHSFCADLNLEGVTYKGYGENKLSARNAAAEQAIRDLIIKKMQRLANGEGEEDGEGALPMIQLASFALYKLFSEWQDEGHKVPQLRPLNSVSESEGAGAAAGAAVTAAAPAPAPAPTPSAPAAPRRVRVLPVNAAALHPCMLLTYMRPHLEYRELPPETRPDNQQAFTMAVDVDGNTYIGKASSKKEARKEAARAACEALFGVTFNPTVTSNQPVVPT